MAQELEKERNKGPTATAIDRAITATTDMFKSQLHAILNDSELQYIKAMVDPFHPDVSGVRIPCINPVDTWTHTQFDTVSLNVSQYNTNGKLVLFFNPTALSTGCVAMLSDPDGSLSSLDSAAPLVKDIRNYDAFRNYSQLRTYGIWGM